MGAGLGWALRQGGDEIYTTLNGRSERSSRFAHEAGFVLLADVDSLLATVEVLLVVTPPAAALPVANVIGRSAGRTGARPLIADLNSIAPTSTVEIEQVLARQGLGLVAGSISGPPPWVRPGAHLYFSGPRSQDVSTLAWQHVTVTDLGSDLCSAKALKMSTASVYKGLVGLFAQAMRTAHHAGVLDVVLADLSRSGYDLLDDVVLAASKSGRYVAEMQEIARTHAAAELSPALFAAFADVWADVSTSPLAAEHPETAQVDGRSPSEIVAMLEPRPL